jgi:hypothetical protein
MIQEQTTSALKEWNVAVNALEQGETILLLRKGGIRETDGKFTVERNRVLLYPTWEHQQPDLLKPNYASQVQSVTSGWHPQDIRISSWATITDLLQVSTAEPVKALYPFHIWNEQFIHNRLKWKPNQPLYVLLLRVYKLLQPQIISYNPKYGGCRSWIELETAIALDQATPVLGEEEYTQQVAQICQVASEFSRTP